MTIIVKIKVMSKSKLISKPMTKFDITSKPRKLLKYKIMSGNKPTSKITKVENNQNKE